MPDEKQLLMDEVELRREELELDYDTGSELDESKINEILRDEFQDESYEDILIQLGISQELDLAFEDPYAKEETLGDTGENHNKLLDTLIVTEKSLFATEMKLKGFNKEGEKWVRRRNELLPSNEILFIIEFLQDNFSPQSLSSKLKEKTSNFDSSMNSMIVKFNERLENYPDNIVSGDELADVIQMLLSKILVVRRITQDGRLGDLLRDMIIKSYNEKNEPLVKKNESLKDIMIG